mmetsp:Transcript_15183/g.27570  ORF Transcript_15183/g.27570 Transcript_15183/m.27570 type:complete len:185 (-) Transcript_15183:436-990(-)|eukprot:CAMPEP_0201867532 /NCGR_PEP_ID=MMETSP0902-20130614/1725_1 /ASSEMBLY_ACC=CAM_ASM_000551 /TAXON_ID=420261 /ORGANISM="Thalassiosira antarctica, Strain CCMP982" /LENGTH=184 /DNA_ID=CAMNT_0048392697 /DNA_START=115 /DNA_END=669 /DNA_ORIENTATION=+
MMPSKNLTVLLAALAATCTSAFVAPTQRTSLTTITTPPSPTQFFAEAGTAAARAGEISDEPEMNPENEKLPALKGDYDWDAEFAADANWITENVPGKMVLSELDLAAQVTELSKIEDRFRKVRQDQEYEKARIIGFVPMAETYNGRFAMFFLVVGLLTELWTGITIPGQIEEMARVGGFIGVDY